MRFSMTEATKSGYQERVTAGSLRSSECPAARLTRRDSRPPMNPPPLSGLGPQLLSSLDLPGCVLSPQTHPVPRPDVGSTSLQDPIQPVGGGHLVGQVLWLRKGKASLLQRRRGVDEGAQSSVPASASPGPMLTSVSCSVWTPLGLDGLFNVNRKPSLGGGCPPPCKHAFYVLPPSPPNQDEWQKQHVC